MKKLLFCLVLFSNACFARIDLFGRYPVIHIWEEEKNSVNIYADEKELVDNTAGACPIEVYADMPDTITKGTDCDIVMRIHNTTSDTITIQNPARRGNTMDYLHHEGKYISLVFDRDPIPIRKVIFIDHTHKRPKKRSGYVSADYFDTIRVPGNETVSVVYDYSLNDLLVYPEVYPSGRYRLGFLIRDNINNLIHINPTYFYYLEGEGQESVEPPATQTSLVK